MGPAAQNTLCNTRSFHLQPGHKEQHSTVVLNELATPKSRPLKKQTKPLKTTKSNKRKQKSIKPVEAA